MTSTLGKFLHTVLGNDSSPALSQIVLYWTYLGVVLGAYLIVPSPRPARPSPAADYQVAGPTTESVAEMR